MRRRALVLAYHNVVPDGLAGRGDRSLHLPMSTFLRQLDLLQAHCRVLTLVDILAGVRDNERPVVAITFDDAYRGAVEHALPELSRRGLPGALFVAPGLLGAQSLWWDELAAVPGGVSATLRATILESDAGRQNAARERIAARARSTLLPECYHCASEEQTLDLASEGSLALGAHSWGHPNLTRIDGEALASELAKPLEWLRARSKLVIPVLAYPYGIQSPEVEAAARRAGYASALLVEGGWLPSDGVNQWAVPRYNVPAGLSDDGFMIRLSGAAA